MSELNLSLITFLTTATIGDLPLGSTRSSIASVLGDPLHWEGKSQLAAADSEIWCYGPLQINFDASSEAETFRFHFTKHVANLTATLDRDFSPFHMIESLDDAFMEINGFETFLEIHGVPYSRSQNRIGQPIVNCGASSITKFSTCTDHNASMEAEKRIAVPGQFIVSSSVSVAH